jgi:hypothetical protein
VNWSPPGNVRKSDADEGAPWATRVHERFNDTYGDESPSRKGIKLWRKAKTPRSGKRAIEHGAIEVYDRVHFFTVTRRSRRILAVTDH